MTKFNDTIAEQILINYENGLPLKHAASLVGVNPSTVWRWRKKGEKAKSGKYHNFYIKMLEARAKFIAYHLNILNNSDNDATHRYLLEVTDPDNFLVKTKLEHSGELTQINKNFDIDEDLLNSILEEKRERYDKITDSDYGEA